MGHLPIYFYGVARSSSRRRDPATTDETETWPPMSRSRDDGGRLSGARHGKDTKLQHFATFSGGWIANSVTASGIRDIVNLERFLRRIFLQ
jgi:hypothetical protein